MKERQAYQGWKALGKPETWCEEDWRRWTAAGHSPPSSAEAVDAPLQVYRHPRRGDGDDVSTALGISWRCSIKG